MNKRIHDNLLNIFNCEGFRDEVRDTNFTSFLIEFALARCREEDDEGATEKRSGFDFLYNLLNVEPIGLIVKNHKTP
jgi:hypothetical protein